MTVVTDTRLSPNYSQGRPEGPPTAIFIHHWGIDGQSHDAVVAYLCRPNGTASAHFVASSGRVTELVKVENRAWHAGPLGTPRGIGIECRPEMSPGDFETVAQLIAELRREHGPIPLRRHSDVMATACPGRWGSQLSALDARATAINNGKPTHGATAPLAEMDTPMRLVRSKQTGTIYAVTPYEITTIRSIGLWKYIAAVYGTEYVDLDDGNIGTLRADADARRASLVAQLAATVGTVDEKRLADQIAPALIDPITNALAKAGPIDADTIRKATTEAVQKLLAKAAAPEVTK